MAPLTFDNNELNSWQSNYKNRMAGEVFAKSNSGGEGESYRNQNFGSSSGASPTASNSNGAVTSAAAVTNPPSKTSGSSFAGDSTSMNKAKPGYTKADMSQYAWLDSYTGPKTFEEALAADTMESAESTAKLFNDAVNYQTQSGYRKQAEEHNAGIFKDKFTGEKIANPYTSKGSKSKASKTSGSRSPGDSTPMNMAKPATSPSSQKKYTVDEIYKKYADLDMAQTGSTKDRNSGSIALYYQGQDEIRRLRRQGLLVDDQGNVIPDK
jgi:hypothetical protein